MEIPFTINQFLGLFELYNKTVWPSHIVAYGLGITAAVSLFIEYRYRDRLIVLILFIFWIWTGMIYHILFFSQINSAAYLFGTLFILQGLLFILMMMRGWHPEFKTGKCSRSALGWVMIIYSMILYPLVGHILGHRFPRSPWFGITPCPLVIFTFGMFLLSRSRLPLYILPIPILWSLIGFSAALNLGMHEDYILPFAGITGTMVLLLKRFREPSDRYKQGVKGTA